MVSRQIAALRDSMEGEDEIEDKNSEIFLSFLFFPLFLLFLHELLGNVLTGN